MHNLPSEVVKPESGVDLRNEHASISTCFPGNCVSGVETHEIRRRMPFEIHFPCVKYPTMLLIWLLIEELIRWVLVTCLN